MLLEALNVLWDFAKLELDLCLYTSVDLAIDSLNADVNEYIYLSVYLSIYGSTVLVDLGRFLSLLIYIQSVGLLGWGSARRKAATYTQDNTNTE
jgi:hypothetical protein